MNVAIFGATGRTGIHLVDEAVSLGHNPVCLVRDESSSKLSSKKVSIVTGSPLEYEDVKKTIDGCEAVFCALNIARESDNPWSKVVSPQNLLEQSMSNIVRVMKEKGIKRILTVSAWGVADSYEETNWMFKLLINKTNVGTAYRGHEQQEKILKESDLEWTSVRPVGLTNSLKHKPTRVSIDGSKKLRMTIGRKDVAKFMLSILKDEQYFRKAPSISND
ncbi:NAD(P)-dependent oxidoreductase [Marinoscillum sp.]|uniref:NAD(P)-dependent oxidoreductase n=1 Tax=Marinoscillum sp. TaxID=2024838 RepID=UPI003BAB42CA